MLKLPELIRVSPVKPTGAGGGFVVAALLALLTFFGAVGDAAAAFPNGYTYRRLITVTAAQVSGGPHTNFPVLVSTTLTDLKTTANGGKVTDAQGDDIIFTASDGSTQLSHEVETYVASTGQLIAWVRVPSLAATSTIYIYYGNSAVTTFQGSVPGSVWDANFKGVWHLKEGTGVTAAAIFHLRHALDEAGFLRNAEIQVEALNHALANVAADRVRMHVCWGNYEGPHTHDIALTKILPIILKAKPMAFLLEGANPRHAHEWEIWKSYKLPADKVLVPGVVETTSNFVEHPEVVAQRIVRYAEVIGRERILAGSDCGFGTFAGFGPVHPSVGWMKLKSLAEGAAIASRKLWGKAGSAS